LQRIFDEFPDGRRGDIENERTRSPTSPMISILPPSLTEAIDAKVLGHREHIYLDNAIHSNSTRELQRFAIPVRRGTIVDNVRNAEVLGDLELFIRRGYRDDCGVRCHCKLESKAATAREITF
jgi:hypothetical protein